MPTVLAIDDERSVRESYRLILSENFRVLLAEHADAAFRVLDTTHVDLILLDLMMPGLSGIPLLKKLRSYTDAPVVVVTAVRSVPTAVEAMKSGAREFLIKPFDVEELLNVIERTLKEEQLSRELRARRATEACTFEDIVGSSPALKEVLDLARRAADVDSTVLITGESGTGKDLLARAIHYAGRRSNGPFVTVSCCAIPATLFESELFGYEKGAFTDARERHIGRIQIADKGTLFLDEIGEMPRETQAKLLRAVQERQIFPVGSTKSIELDVRYICATNRNLEEAVAAGIFREDLYYRINVLAIEIPPLRRRREDIPLLAQHFLEKHAPRVHARAKGFRPDALVALAAYDWPGNVRELENLIERVLVHHNDVEVISETQVKSLLPTNGHSQPFVWSELEGLPLEEATQRLERHLILRALQRANYVQLRAAELLGTTRRILKYKMDQLGIADKPPDEVRENDKNSVAFFSHQDRKEER